MSSKPQEHAASGALIEIKAGSVNLLIVKLLGDDVAAIAAQLGEKVRQAPEFFRNAPVVLDLGHFPDGRPAPDLAALLPMLRARGLSPVGVRGGGDALHRRAESAGLALLADARAEAAPAAAPKPVRSAPAATAQPAAETKRIDHPVRSGQRIYAPGGDLIVLAPVSAGAEIMADGNIHIYSSLRGRALAGVQGNLESRIFCLDLQAELIAIAGHYRISENLEESLRGKPVQVYLLDDALLIDDL